MSPLRILVMLTFLVKLQQPNVAGLHDHGSTKLYVCRGTGY
jgi:predicted MPP superfamily phosphohydrolase